LAEAGLLATDPGIDSVRLRELYVEQELTTREVAARLGVNKGRVLRAMATTGIEARSRSRRRASGPRAQVTDQAMRELFRDSAMTVAEAARYFGVSEGYLRGRATGLGLTKRPGSFTPHLPTRTLQDLTGRPPELYRQGWTLTRIAAELGTSAQSVRLALHRARVPVRAGGGARADAARPGC